MADFIFSCELGVGAESLSLTFILLLRISFSCHNYSLIEFVKCIIVNYCVSFVIAVVLVYECNYNMELALFSALIISNNNNNNNTFI